jgi:hypothetical protein
MGSNSINLVNEHGYRYHATPVVVESGLLASEPGACIQCPIMLLKDFRRLRCNRQQPCQNCTTRAEQATCKYRGSDNLSSFPVPPRKEQENVDAMQQRILRLESLVKSLVAQSQANDDQPSEDPNLQNIPFRPSRNRFDDGTRMNMSATTNDALEALPRSGTTVIDEGQSVYRPADNWVDLLEEVILLCSFLQSALSLCLLR